MADFWVVVADASGARFFRGTSPNSELEEFHGMEHAASREREGDLVTDKEGRFVDENAPGSGPQGTAGKPARSSTEPTAKEHEADAFASEVADYLDRNSGSGEFKHLSIIASPKFLGRLRDRIADHTEEKVLEDVNKNLTDADEETIRESLERLPSGFK